MTSVSARSVLTDDDPGAAFSGKEIVAQLRAIEEQLRKPRALLESIFLDVGRNLTDCAGQLAEITRTFESLSGDLASESVTAATSRLSAVGQKVQEMSGSLGAEGAGLERLMGIVEAIGRPIDDLSEIMKVINVVAINARIAATHVDKGGGDLSVFTADISRLSSHASSTIGSFVAAHERLVRVLRATIQTWMLFEKEHGGTLGVLAKNLSQNLTVIADHRRQAVAASTETGLSSKRITDRLGTAVVALQVGDITRQRVEHVEEALRSALGNFDEADSENKGAAIVAAICRLQSAQMKQVLSDFEGESRQIVGALGSLADDAEHIVQRSKDTFGGKAETDNSFLGALDSELQTACSLIRTFEKASAELRATAEGVLEGVDEMLGYAEVISRIESDLRIVGLNMSLKCLRLGDDGRALNIIAQQLREFVVQTVVAAQSIKQHLGDASSLARSMKDGAIIGQTQQEARLDKEADEALTLLRSIDENLTHALAFMTRNGASVSVDLRQALAGIATYSEISGVFRESVARMDGLSTTCINEDDAESRAMVDAAMSQLGGRYTMEAERQLHRQIQRSPADNMLEVQAPSVSEQDSLDDVFL